MKKLNVDKLAIIAVAVLGAAAIAVTLIFTIKANNEKDNNTSSEAKKDTSSTRSYTQSELNEIQNWWSTVSITQDGDIPLEK
ncbi:MAG: hypothetical protein KBS52_06115 [Clostridiales bacterium]|nr:hypothetical protein [Candidatus Equinaster intestinalis]